MSPQVANLFVVVLVVVATFSLILLLLERSPPEPPGSAFVTQALVLWLIAWVFWGALWGIRAAPPPNELSKSDLKDVRALLADLQAPVLPTPTGGTEKK